eukprot:2739576-Pleurochrysis_carterae.AAC.3
MEVKPVYACTMTILLKDKVAAWADHSAHTLHTGDWTTLLCTVYTFGGRGTWKCEWAWGTIRLLRRSGMQPPANARGHFL